MKEHPLLCNDAAVRGILAGAKITTWRPVRGPGRGRRYYWTDLIQDTDIGDDGRKISLGFEDAYGDWHKTESVCPYGQPGDRLYVREAWRVHTWDENSGMIQVEYRDGSISDSLDCPDEEMFERLWIQSSDDAQKKAVKYNEDGQYCWGIGEAPTRWRPNIHMPKWAARTWLEIATLDVRLVAETTPAEAVADGFETVAGFMEFWRETYGVAPWAWKIGIRRVAC